MDVSVVIPRRNRPENPRHALTKALRLGNDGVSIKFHKLPFVRLFDASPDVTSQGLKLRFLTCLLSAQVLEGHGDQFTCTQEGTMLNGIIHELLKVIIKVDGDGRHGEMVNSDRAWRKAVRGAQ